MVRLYLLLLSFSSLTILAPYADSKGLVKEFAIEESKNVTLENGTHSRNKTKPNILLTKKEIYANKTRTHNDHKKGPSQIHDTSMYTETDLEETSSNNHKFDGPNKNGDLVNNTKEKRRIVNEETEMSNIYTDSDLEATSSKDKKKHGETPEKDKKSAGSYLFVPHKRDVDGTEQEEGSGEGSGNEPLTNETS